MKIARKLAALSCTVIIVAITVSVMSVPKALGESDSSEKRPLSILLVAEDSAGHSLPLLALGETLRDRGHNVSVVTGQISVGHGKKLTELCSERSLPLYTYGHTHEIDPTKAVSAGGAIYSLTVVLPLLVELQDTIIEALSTEHLANTDVVVLDVFFPAVTHWLNSNTNITVITFSQSVPAAFDTLPPWYYPSMLGGGGPEPFVNHRFIAAIFPMVAGAIVNTVGYRYKHYLPMYTPAGVCNPEIAGVEFGFDYPRPLYPMMHYVGPVVSKKEEVLPDELQAWLDRHSPRSVLYISMGSMFTTSKELAISVVDAVVRSNYDILWTMKDNNRFVFDDIDQELLQNGSLYISSWLPQAKVLRHPSISVAILHCGLGGVNEAIMAGVPIIGSPIAFDQFINCARIHNQGLGVCLHGTGSLTSDLLQHSIKEIEGGSYRETIRRLNVIFRDAGGVERAADLIEHYHKVGYGHLVPFWAKHQWSTVQYYNLDVYAVLAGVVMLVAFALYKCSRCVCSRVSCREHSLSRKTKED